MLNMVRINIWKLNDLHDIITNSIVLYNVGQKKCPSISKNNYLINKRRIFFMFKSLLSLFSRKEKKAFIIILSFGIKRQLFFNLKTLISFLFFNTLVISRNKLTIAYDKKEYELEGKKLSEFIYFATSSLKSGVESFYKIAKTIKQFFSAKKFFSIKINLKELELFYSRNLASCFLTININKCRQWDSFIRSIEIDIACDICAKMVLQNALDFTIFFFLKIKPTKIKSLLLNGNKNFRKEKLNQKIKTIKNHKKWGSNFYHEKSCFFQKEPLPLLFFKFYHFLKPKCSRWYEQKSHKLLDNRIPKKCLSYEFPKINKNNLKIFLNKSKEIKGSLGHNLRSIVEEKKEIYQNNKFETIAKRIL